LRPAVRHPAIRIAAFALGFRIVSAVIGFFILVLFPLHQRAAFTVMERANPFWDAFARWDSGWYFGIARSGYQYVEGGRNNLAFFPVYPMLMRHVGRLFGRTPADVYFGGIVVSWAAFLVAMIVLYKLARLDLPAPRAERAVLLTTIFPFAHFFGIVYTESLFLLCVVTAFYAFRTRRWIWGGLAAGVATATRVNGILMVPALAWIAWRTASDWRERLLAGAGLVLATSGVAVYSLWVYSVSGNPLEWAASIERWGYTPGGSPLLAPVRLVQALVLQPYTYLTTVPSAPYDTLNGITGIAVLAAVPFIWRRFGAAYGMYMAVNLWLPLSSGQYEGWGRYCSVMFPWFIWLAGVRSRAVAMSLLVVFAVFYTLCFGLFLTLHPLY
jgi:hypothetical protein